MPPHAERQLHQGHGRRRQRRLGHQSQSVPEIHLDRPEGGLQTICQHGSEVKDHKQNSGSGSADQLQNRMLTRVLCAIQVFLQAVHRRVPQQPNYTQDPHPLSKLHPLSDQHTGKTPLTCADLCGRNAHLILALPPRHVAGRYAQPSV